MKILIVEDDKKIANAIKKGFEQEKFVVDTANDGDAGYDLAASETYDVLVLDLMLPKMSGTEICKKLRINENHTPILMLTALGELSDKLDGFETGADDYLVKPFAFTELLARVRSLARRPKEIYSTNINVGKININTTTFEVKVNKKAVQLSRKEFSILEYLMKNAGKVVTKENLISSVWNYESNILPNTVEVFVRYLREKIGKAAIKTVRGYGYTIENV